MRTLILGLLGSLAFVSTHAASRLVGSLPRVGSAPLEGSPGVDTEYSELQTSDGARLRVIVTKPEKRTGRLPAVHFVQWLSCDSIELAPDARDGWSLMLRRLITESDALVMRVDKAGVGDSRGPSCAQLDYETELAHHREAFRLLRTRGDVDPNRIVIFGASMGTTYAPLVARNEQVAGVAVWGGGARTWFERQLAFDRRAMELSGHTPADLARDMTRHAEFQWLYLQQRLAPAEIAKRRPELASVWGEIRGTSATGQYGRPFAFHWQAQAQNWAGAWAQVQAPVLALLGEYDWFEDPRSAELIATVAPRGEFHLIRGLDHHFTRYPNAAAAFAEKGGVADPDPAMAELLRWLRVRFTSG